MIMGNKGNSRHIKGLNAPRYYGVHRKEYAYAAKADAGRHTLQKSLPLSLAIRKLGIAASLKESQRIIRQGNISVLGKVRREPSFPVGISDTIETKGAPRYALSVNEQGKAAFSEVAKDASTYYKIVGRYKTKKGVVMARLHDGANVLLKGAFKPGDSVAMDAKGAKGVVSLKEGSKCTIIDGVHAGTTGTIKELKPGSMKAGPSAVIEEQRGQSFETLVRNLIVTE